MDQHDLLALARKTGRERARPLESNFPVGAAFEFSNLEVRGGANYEDVGRTPIGACAERSTLLAANNEFGPLSNGRGDGRVLWVTAALWAGIESPITPCGICRDAMSAAGSPESEIISRGEGVREFRATMAELLPLPGREKNRDVSEEIERWAKLGGPISESISAAHAELLDHARTAADRSYLPPFTSEPPAGAALQMQDGSVLTGWFVTDATTRLGGSAIAMAVRRALEGPCQTMPRAVRVALFTNAEMLRAPNGYDLQLLLEVADPEASIVFSCLKGRAFTTSVGALYPHSFGRKDLGY